DRAREHIRPWVGPTFVTDDVDGARATLKRYAEAQADDGARMYGIWRDGALAGGVMFTVFDAAFGGCEIGCWLEPSAEGHGLVTQACGALVDWAFTSRGLRLEPSAEGHGLVTQACGALVDWAFTSRGLHRAEWHCRADNDRSSA
ncbi:GNAT family N-acetyltransferase, partial [Streptomyces sp. MCAF7]